MKKLVSILMILAMIIPLAGAQSTDIFKKKKKKKSKTEAVDKAKADSIAKSKKDALQPYAKVITGKAKTMDGFFNISAITSMHRKLMVAFSCAMKVWVLIGKYPLPRPF